MIYEIFINYMTEILSLRLEITMCTLVEIEFPVFKGLLVKSSRQIQVQKSIVRRLHAIFRSKVAVLDPRYKLAYVNYCFNDFLEEDCAKIWTNKVEEAFPRLCDDYYMRMSKEKYSQTQSCTPIEGFGFQSQSEIPSISSSGSYKARAAVHDRFKQSNKTCLHDAKTEVARYLDEARIDSIGDEYLHLLTWWKVNSSRFKIISQVVGASTSKPLDDMAEEIDGAEEIDEEFINIGKEMEATFENLNNDSMAIFGAYLSFIEEKGSLDVVLKLLEFDDYIFCVDNH
uniref:hAT-like transposase RNase-H fold domain-containing protein n=1 Tax=Cucumis melo TaxID=3656 RepID=A0A9I9EA44_CUCME